MEEKRIKERKDGSFSFQKAWEVVFPFLLYYLVFNTAFIILAFACQAGMEYLGEGFRQFMTAYETTVSGVAGGLCSMIGILPLLPMLKKELRMRTAGIPGTDAVQVRIIELTKTVIFAVAISLGMNAFLALTGFAASSQTYQEVAEHQYGVVFSIGLFLYGLVSPLAEEVVFRGIIYNRLRRLFGPVIGIVASALFFGAFHGNLVQGVYGAVMGIFMAYLYERSGKFFIPVLFHAAANLAVYTAAHLQTVQAALFTPWGCSVLLAVAVVCVFLEEKRKDN